MSYRELHNERGRLPRMRRLAVSERQVEIHLDQFRIERQNGIHLTTMQAEMLRSYGVETAADISPDLNNVPGIGRPLVNQLLQWRADLIDRFVPGPEHALSDTDQKDINVQLARQRDRLRETLAAGPAELDAIRRYSISERKKLQPRFEQAILDYRQARVDHDALN